MQCVQPRRAYPRVFRAMARQPAPINGLSRPDHILLLADQHPDSEASIALAVELSRFFGARLTLMHGGNLRHDPAFWTSIFQDPPDPNQTRLALLGLLWDVRKLYPEVGLYTGSARCPEDVLQAADQQAVGLLVLPASLFERFLPLRTVAGREEAVPSAPCPLLVVEGLCVGAGSRSMRA